MIVVESFESVLWFAGVQTSEASTAHERDSVHHGEGHDAHVSSARTAKRAPRDAAAHGRAKVRRGAGLGSCSIQSGERLCMWHPPPVPLRDDRGDDDAPRAFNQPALKSP